MKKSLLIKLAIVLVVLTLSYCVFWFFKAGQTEKQINKFISDNSSHISAGEVVISGLPLSQKITINDLKITVPANIVSKRQINVKKLEASASVFSNNFNVVIVEGIKLQDLENVGDVYDLEFSNQPEIIISLANGILSKFQYNDSGFKVLDAEKNVVNSSTGTKITFETSIDETEKKTSKVHISFKELEGYSIIDFYKNAYEKKVVEGIKTEEIKINNVSITDLTTPSAGSENANLASANASPINSKENKEANKKSNATQNSKDSKAPKVVAVNNPNLNVAPTEMAVADGKEAVKKAMEQNNKNPQDAKVVNPAPANVDNNSKNNVTTDSQNPQVTPAVQDLANPQTEANAEVATDAIADSSIVKSNVVIDLTITLTPSVKQQSEAPTDPSQIQELPVQNVQNIKIENIEFSNPLYKINISGDIVNSSDDNNPSGGVTIKVEKINNLLQQLKSQFKKHAEDKKSSTPASSEDVGADVAQPNTIANYDVFLLNVSDKLADVVMEISSKNSVSKDDISQFDIRREKNLEFLVNEVPVREIVGKF